MLAIKASVTRRGTSHSLRIRLKRLADGSTTQAMAGTPPCTSVLDSLRGLDDGVNYDRDLVPCKPDIETVKTARAGL